MAGTDSRFDATAFRDAIRFAMTMGLPDTETERATFIWNVDREFVIDDAAGSPFEWGETAAYTSTYGEVQIPVAVEFLSKGGDTQDTRLGQMDVSRIIVTILDEDFPALEQVSQGHAGHFADKIRFGGPIAAVTDQEYAYYDIQFVGPPLGLFDVTVYQVYAQAIDES